MPPRRRKRLDPASFDLPIEKLRGGEFTDRPSLRAREVLRDDPDVPRVTLQVSSERAGLLAGADEAIALLKLGCEDWGALAVHALYDGDRLEAAETVMTIEGPYALFAHLEPLVVGVLARRTRVATQTRLLAETARIKPVLVFTARNDVWQAQAGDAHAVGIGGGHPTADDVALSGRGAPKVALVPYALVAATEGDAVRASQRFGEHVGEGVELLVPVDYENDATRTAIEVARAMAGRLWGVRLATSEYLVDKSIIPQMGTFPPTGVNPQLVWNVRNALDAEGFGEVRIVATGDFGVERIRRYEEDGVPVDAYGAPVTLFAERFGFAADVVAVNGRAVERPGREARPSSRLEKVK